MRPIHRPNTVLLLLYLRAIGYAQKHRVEERTCQHYAISP